MKFTIFIVTLLTTFESFGQLSIVTDNRGYIDVKEDTFENSKIVGRIFDGDIFLCDIGYDDGNDEWEAVAYSPEISTIEPYKKTYYHLHKNSGSLYFLGYVRKGHIESIENLEHIPTDKNHRITKDSTLLIWNDSIKLEITIIPFNAKHHKIEKDQKSGSVIKIDGKKPKELPDLFPNREFSKIRLTINNKLVKIPKSQYDDLFDPALNDINVFFDKKGNIYIHMPDKSDGGGYTAAWLIIKGIYVKRYFDGIG